MSAKALLYYIYRAKPWGVRENALCSIEHRVFQQAVLLTDKECYKAPSELQYVEILIL